LTAPGSDAAAAGLWFDFLSIPLPSPRLSRN
jgi:hypothetical protein